MIKIIIISILIILSLGSFFIYRISRKIPPEKVPLFVLDSEFEGFLNSEWRETSTGPDDDLKEATQTEYSSDIGRIHLTVNNEKLLVQVIYNLNGKTDTVKKYLFDHYSGNSKWKFILDNGFGQTYNREDNKLQALWSNLRILTFRKLHYKEEV